LFAKSRNCGNTYFIIPQVYCQYPRARGPGGPKFRKSLDKWYFLCDNVCCHCVKALNQPEIIASINPKGVHQIAQDLPAQKAPEKKGAWLQKKNENG
jgi:hypothetical protein